MAQTTSVLWTEQSLSEEAKEQARENIGAAAAEDIPTNKSEIKVYEGSKTVYKNLMTIYEDSTTGAQAGITFNNENSKVSMVKKPAEGDGGKVLTVVEPGGQIAPYYEWKELEPDSLVITYSGSPQLSETDYQKMVSYVSDHKMVYIMAGIGGTSAFYKLSSVSSSGYVFINESDNSKTLMHIANNRAVTTTTYSSQTKIMHEFFFPAGGSDRQTILEVFKVPQLNGKWPTKIVGTFNCTPENGYTGISILPLETYTRQLNGTPYTIETPTSFPDRPSPNWYLYQYELPSDEESKRIKNISGLTVNKNNTVNFELEQGNKLLKYIAIKGFATSDNNAPYVKYNITNLNLTYYYD